MTQIVPNMCKENDAKSLDGSQNSPETWIKKKHMETKTYRRKPNSPKGGEKPDANQNQREKDGSKPIW